MRVLVTGASGLVGRTLSAFLSTQGHEVVPLARGEGLDGAGTWGTLWFTPSPPTP